MVAKQKHRHRRSRVSVIAYCLLLVIGVVASAYALRSVALLLPWQAVAHYAADATMWPIGQLFCILAIALVVTGYYYIGRQTTALVFTGLALLALVPTVMMYGGLTSYAAQHDVTLDPGAQQHAKRDVFAPTATVRYGSAAGHDLYLSVYATPDITKPSPAIVYVHGGGWSGGSRTENSELFHWLNSLGYSVFSIDYRTSHRGYASWQDAPRDVVCALAWLGSAKNSVQIDQSRVTLIGNSAGGQLALRAAYAAPDAGDMASSCGGEPVTVHSVIGIVPAVDFADLYDSSATKGGSRPNVVRYLGGTPETAQEAYNDATIVNHVRAGVPSTLIINAANDMMVTPNSGEALVARLQAVGVHAEHYTIPYAAHSYWINPGGYQNQISRGLIAQFLAEH